jgi:hypothetical protein
LEEDGAIELVAFENEVTVGPPQEGRLGAVLTFTDLAVEGVACRS